MKFVRSEGRKVKLHKHNFTDIGTADNPIVSETSSKRVFSLNFSKSNFLNFGKFIVALVLLLYFGSYAISGYENAKITENSTSETITHTFNDVDYSYEIKDVNYNWDNKLIQLSFFKNVFTGNDKFYDELYYEYSNYKCMILDFTSDSDYIRTQFENYYLKDEKILLLYNANLITLHSKTKRITSWTDFTQEKLYFYLEITDIVVGGSQELNDAINYAYKNYVTDLTIDSYINYTTESNFSLSDILVFPIKVIGNLCYNFGVLVNFIINW